MANVITQTPFILDTTGTTVVSGNQNIAVLVISGMTVNGQLSLKDGLGNICFAMDQLWSGMANEYYFPRDRPLVFASGITVATISSGRVFLYPY